MMETKKEWAKQIFQVVCVVSDLEETLGNWKRLVEFDESSIKRGETDRSAQHIYRGRAIACPIRYARFDLGGVDMKLVEPLNKFGGDPYSDRLLEKGQGFHHVGICVESCGEFAAHCGKLGLKPLYEEITEGQRLQLYALEEKIGMSIAPRERMTGPCGGRDGRGRTL